jgi:hypothetical protein
MPEWPNDHEPDLFVVSIEGLFVAFSEARCRYEQVLRGDDDLKGKFRAMFPKYGTIGFGSYMVKQV